MHNFPQWVIPIIYALTAAFVAACFAQLFNPSYVIPSALEKVMLSLIAGVSAYLGGLAFTKRKNDDDDRHAR